MAQITVTLPDGSTRVVDHGTPVRDIAAGVSPRLAKAALAAALELAPVASLKQDIRQLQAKLDARQPLQ